jgi:hypothetical protein
MIIQKLKPCKSCQKLSKIFSKGCCLSCSKKTYKPIKKTTERGLAKRKEERSEYPEFFQEAIRRFNTDPYCVETGKRIWNMSSVNCGHLYPKRKYKSVSVDFDNIICLSWEMHTLLDGYLDTMQIDKIKEKMPNTWKVIKEKVLLLKDKILETGKLRDALEREILD